MECPATLKDVALKMIHQWQLNVKPFHNLETALATFVNRICAIIANRTHFESKLSAKYRSQN